MGNYKILIWHLTVVFLVNVFIIRHSETNNLIEQDLTDYGALLSARQFEDGKMLIATMNGSAYLLYLIYQNGSIIPVNYNHSISSPDLILMDFKPLTTDHVLMIYDSTNYSSKKRTLLGIIINLNSHGKVTVTDNITLMYQYNGTQHNGTKDYTVTDYSSISQSFVFTYRTYDPKFWYNMNNYLNWTKYKFSQSDGTATPISNGIIKLRNGFDLKNHDAFTTIDGHH
ncbi:16924_t:CDS:2, partial [Racocetra persica]